jgi:sulfide dehydrogenase cytochrome subunit
MDLKALSTFLVRKLFVTAMLLLLPNLSMAEKPSQADKLVTLCRSCHIADAPKQYATLPERSAGETLAVLKAYRDGEREGTVMPRLMRGFTDEQLALISQTISTENP